MTNSYIERFCRITIIGIIALIVAMIVNPLLAVAPFLIATVVVLLIWYPAETRTAIDNAIAKLSVTIPQIEWWPILYHGSAIVVITLLGVLIAAGAIYLLEGERFREYMKEGLDSTSDGDSSE